MPTTFLDNHISGVYNQLNNKILKKSNKHR